MWFHADVCPLLWRHASAPPVSLDSRKDTSRAPLILSVCKAVCYIPSSPQNPTPFMCGCPQLASKRGTCRPPHCTRLPAAPPGKAHNGASFIELVLPPDETPQDTRYKINWMGSQPLPMQAGALYSVFCILSIPLTGLLEPAATARGPQYVVNQL